MSKLPLSLIGAALTATVGMGSAAAAVTVTAAGDVKMYADDPEVATWPDWGRTVEAGREVTLTVKWRGAATSGGLCQGSFINASSIVVTTDSSGHYSATLPTSLSSAPLYPCKTSTSIFAPLFTAHFEVYTNVTGTEDYGLWSLQDSYSPVTPTTSFATASIARAPHAISTENAGASGFWARRFGKGKYPVFFIEGFDPNDGVKTWMAACPSGATDCAGIREMLMGSKIGAGATESFYQQFANHPTYSLWVITGGVNSTKSLYTNWRWGYDASQDGIDGQVYQAMKLITSIKNDTRWGHRGTSVPMVVGGFSAGGLIAKTGLRQLCSGRWASLPNNPWDQLDPAICNQVSLWYAADSPLRGANVPVSLQRYMCDKTAIGTNSDAGANCWKMGNRATSEMLVNWISPGKFLEPNETGATSWGGCNTECFDADGCSSPNTLWCAVDQTNRNSFVDWAGGSSYPSATYPGTANLIPSVVMSVGGNPAVDYYTARCSNGSYPGSGVYLNNRFDCTRNCLLGFNDPGDHWLIPDSSGGSKECGYGAVLDSLSSVNGMHGSFVHDYSDEGMGIFGTADISWAITVNYYPTFIRSVSSLEACSSYFCNAGVPASTHKDYWYNASSGFNNHFAPLAMGASQFLTGWISEYLIGKKTSVVANHPHKKLGLKSGAYRPAVAERGGIRGVDDDGDDFIDDAYNAHCGDLYCDPEERTCDGFCSADCSGSCSGTLPASTYNDGICASNEPSPPTCACNDCGLCSFCNPVGELTK